MSFAASAAAFRNNTGFYFGDEEPQAKRVSRASKPTESSADLLALPQTKIPSDADINPYAFAMASIYSRSRPNSRAHSRANTPAPSRPSSVHREAASADNKEINPYAYAMGSIYKRSHSRSRSTTPAASRAASIHEESKELGSFAKMWRRSFSRTSSAQNSRASSVAPAHN